MDKVFKYYKYIKGDIHNSFTNGKIYKVYSSDEVNVKNIVIMNIERYIVGDNGTIYRDSIIKHWFKDVTLEEERRLKLERLNGI